MRREMIFFTMMLIVIPFSPIFTTTAYGQLFSNLEREWITTYDGTGSGLIDAANAITCDSVGNIYITGKSKGNGNAWEYATVKYDTHGNEIWSARYDGPESNYDIATDIGVDQSGNVYVTGYSYFPETDDDFMTIKYDSSGNELWAVRYGTGQAHENEANAIAIDDSGFIYVTGGHATIKYDPDGNLLWALGGNGTLEDIALAPNGDVIAAGRMYEYFATGRYTADGTILWTNTYGYIGRAYAATVDENGNVYVVGNDLQYDESPSYYDCVIVKYDSEGTELWVERYALQPRRALSDVGYDVIVDGEGNVYVTGRSGHEDTSYDIITLKYDTDGNQKWVNSYNGAGDWYDEGSVIAQGPGNNIFVAGYSTNENDNRDSIILKYSPAGKEMWVDIYNGPEGSGDDATDLVIDSRGNVIITGKSTVDVDDSDFTTIKYIPSPHHFTPVELR